MQPPPASYLKQAKARSAAVAPRAVVAPQSRGLPTSGPPPRSRALPALLAAPLLLPLGLILMKLLLLMIPAILIWFQASWGAVCIDYRTPWADSHRAWWGCQPGWEGPCCDIQQGYSEGEFLLRRIKNDEVELEMPYGGPRSIDNSSAPPDDMRGLWWLDQRLVHKAGMAEHEGYVEEAWAVSAAEEMVISFSEGVWHPASRCLKPVPTYGGARGHWSWFDVTGTGRNPGAGAGLRGNYEFCYKGDDYILINMRYRVFGFLWLTVPNFFTTLTMERRAFGFTRVTRVGPDALRRIEPNWSWFLLIPIPFELLLRVVGLSIEGTQHYYHYPGTGSPGSPWPPATSARFLRRTLPTRPIPCSFSSGLLTPPFLYLSVFQIVDGDGQRTRHYDAYLQFANTDTNATENTFEAGRNRGHGTSLVGSEAEYCRARNLTCHLASEPPEPGSMWAVLEDGCF